MIKTTNNPASTPSLKTQIRLKLKRILYSLVKEDYNLFTVFDLTPEARNYLIKYLDDIEQLKPYFSPEEHKDITSSIKEHIYLALNQKLKNKKERQVSLKQIKQITKELGTAQDLLEEQNPDKIIDKTAKLKKVNLGHVLWLMFKYFMIFTLFVALYIPLVMAFLITAIGGMIILCLWFINPQHLFGQTIVFTSSLGSLTPVALIGMILFCLSLFLLTIYLVFKLHWNKSIIRHKFLIIAPLIVGLIMMIAAGLGFVTMNRQRVEETESNQITIQPNSSLTINQLWGNLDIIGDDQLTDTIKYEVTRSATGYTQESARQNLKNIDLSIEQNRNKIIISSFYHPSVQRMYHFENIAITLYVPTNLAISFDQELPDLETISMFGFHQPMSRISAKHLTSDLDLSNRSIDLYLEDIKNQQLNITNRYGRIRALDIESTAGINLTGNSGTIQLTNIKTNSNFTLESSYGAITIENLTAQRSQISGRSGSIRLTKINSPTTIVSNNYGEIIIKDLVGNLTLKASSGAISVENLLGDGDITTKYGSTRVKSMDGVLKISGSSGEINVDDLKGRVDITNRYGSIVVDFTEVTPLSQNQITNDSGEVRLTIPAENQPVVYSSARSGSTKNDFWANQPGEFSPTFVINVTYGEVRVAKK